MNRSLRIGALLAIVAAAGCGGAGTRAAGPTTATPTLVTTAAGPPRVPVISCASSYGVAPAKSGTRLPADLTIDLPVGTAGQLSYYTDDTRMLPPVLGPRAWRCQVQIGADGTTGVDLWPGGPAPTSAGANGQPGVDAASDAGCQGCVYSTVCALVPGAAAQLGYVGLPCPPLAAGTTVDFIRGSAAARPPVDDVIGFADPTAPTVTNGVVLYRQHGRLGGSASQETCNLPAAQHDLCTTILNRFTLTNWLMRT